MNGRLREWRCVASRSGVVAAVAFFVARSASQCWGATNARFYEMGESDPGAAIGGAVDLTNGTVDIQSGTDPTYGDDDQGEFVPLTVGLADQPSYVEGWSGSGSLAIDFDVVGDFGGQLTSGPIDPRYWEPNNWAILSQAWVKPDIARTGTRQTLWELGDMGKR